MLEYKYIINVYYLSMWMKVLEPTLSDFLHAVLRERQVASLVEP